MSGRPSVMTEAVLRRAIRLDRLRKRLSQKAIAHHLGVDISTMRQALARVRKP